MHNLSIFHHSIVQPVFIFPLSILSIHLPIFLFMHPSTHLFTHLSIHPSYTSPHSSFFYQFNPLFIFSSLHPSSHPSIHLSSPSSIHPLVHLFNLLSLYSSFHALFIYLSFSFIHYPYCHPSFQPSSLHPSIHLPVFTNR